MLTDDTVTTGDATTDGPQVEFLNQERRTPVVLLLDVSGSILRALVMLIASLRSFGEDLARNTLVRDRAELAIIAFGDDKVTIVQDFTTAAEFVAPNLAAGGNTPLGRGINTSLDKIKERKETYRQHGIEYTRPLFFIITDARGTDDVTIATERLHREVARGSVEVFAVGFGDVDMTALAAIAPPSRPPLQLQGLKFCELFVWLRNSIQRVSTSKTGAQVSLPPTDSWAVTTT